MSGNLFQVINESHFDEILNNNIQNMIVVMLSSKNCTPCKTIKPKFVELSKLEQNRDVFFVYIDRSNFQLTQNKYFTEFEFTPTFVFYFGGNKIAFVEGAHEPSLVRAIEVLKQKINQKRQEFEQKEKLLEEQKVNELQKINVKPNPVSEELILLNKKMELLQQLSNLMSMGAKLTKKYNLDSTLDELTFEYNFQTNQQFRQYVLSKELNETNTKTSTDDVPPELPPLPPFEEQEKEQAQQVQQIQQTNNNDLLKKQEQVKQIRELDLLNQKMQAVSFQKLQQLRKIQQMKEEQEKHQEKNQ